VNGGVFFKLISIFFIFDDKFSNDFVERKYKFFNQIIELFLNWIIGSANVNNNGTNLDGIKFHKILLSMNLPQKLDKKEYKSIFCLFIGSKSPNISHNNFDDWVIFKLFFVTCVTFYMPSYQLCNAFTTETAHVLTSIVQLQQMFEYCGDVR